MLIILVLLKRGKYNKTKALRKERICTSVNNGRKLKCYHILVINNLNGTIMSGEP